MPFKIEGLEVTASDDKHTAYRLADGSTLAITAPPMMGDVIPQSSHAVAEHVRNAAVALAKLNTVRRSVAADADLSDAGRAKQIEAARNIALAAVRDGEAAIDRLEVANVGHVAEAYAVPALERDDIEGALIDQEIRNYARQIQGDAAATKAFTEMLLTSPRHLEAIKRSPVPMNVVSEIADRVWNDRVKASHLGIRAEGYSEAIGWGRTNLASFKTKL